MLTPKEQMPIICKGVHQRMSGKEIGKKTIPEDVPILLIDIDKDTLLDIIPQLIEWKYVKSKSEFIWLINQGEIQINGDKIEEDEFDRVLINDDVINIGKKKFIKINK